MVLARKIRSPPSSRSEGRGRAIGYSLTEWVESLVAFSASASVPAPEACDWALKLMTGAETLYDVREILDVLPHRFPILLVDRIVEFEEGKRIVGLKNVTINEPFFQGHFPGVPIMPGVLIIESMAQVGGFLVFKSIPDRKTKLVYFMGIEGCRFRKPVVPGDQIRIEMTVVRVKTRFGKLRGDAFVDGERVASAEIMFSLVDKPGSGPSSQESDES